MFERNPDKVKIAAEVRVMWPDGPSREWRVGNAGRYICQDCQVPVIGVYRTRQVAKRGVLWICANCKASLKPKKVVSDVNN